MKPRRCASVEYTLAGMRFNSVSTRHTSDTFHVCYEVTSVNTAELRSAMHDGDRRNTGKSVDHGSVMERSVAGVAEQSGIKKNKGKQRYHHSTPYQRSMSPWTNGMLSIIWSAAFEQREGRFSSERQGVCDRNPLLNQNHCRLLPVPRDRHRS